VSAEGYVRFLKKMGHRVIVGDSTCWFNVSRGVYTNFPFHRPAQPDPDEIRRVLGLGGVVARCTCETEEGRPSYKVVCADKKYDFGSLRQKGRNRTRRGMENCSVLRRLDFEELEPLGALQLNRETFIRQQRRVPANHDNYWRKYYAAAATVDSMETWGAFVRDDLAAYLIACRIEDCMNVLILRSSIDHLKDNPNNALFFSFVRETMSRPEMKELSLGLEPVEPGLEGLDRFKMQMGFTKVPIGQKIYVNRLVRPFCHVRLLKGFQRLAAYYPQSKSTRKFAGLIDWYCDQMLGEKTALHDHGPLQQCTSPTINTRQKE
jgi:hypothetical protein